MGDKDRWVEASTDALQGQAGWTEVLENTLISLLRNPHADNQEDLHGGLQKVDSIDQKTSQICTTNVSMWTPKSSLAVYPGM